MVACPICGFDPGGLAPADGVVALRSFPRRFGELVRDDDPERDTKLAIVRGEENAAAREISAAGERLRRVLISDDPSLDAGDTAPGGDLASIANAVADLAASAHGAQWQRTGRRGGTTVTALDLLGDAVHAGVHHLRLAERSLA